MKENKIFKCCIFKIKIIYLYGKRTQDIVYEKTNNTKYCVKIADKINEKHKRKGPR